MKLVEEEVRVTVPDDGTSESTAIRCLVIRPDRGERWPGVLLYTDIFQLTDSTMRTARRFASHGFVVIAPEIYPRTEVAGVALAFDDAGKSAGQAAAAATRTAHFDADRVAVLGYLAGRSDVAGPLRAVGFCIGGHLAFRAALDERVGATACFYPTGLQKGALGADADAGTLGQAHRIGGRLLLVFGSEDPHVPVAARTQIIAELERQGKGVEVAVFAAEHAFMRDEGPRYDPAVTDAAFAVALTFLRVPA